MEVNVRGKEHVLDEHTLAMLPGTNPPTMIVLTPQMIHNRNFGGGNATCVQYEETLCSTQKL